MLPRREALMSCRAWITATLPPRSRHRQHAARLSQDSKRTATPQRQRVQRCLRREGGVSPARVLAECGAVARDMARKRGRIVESYDARDAPEKKR